MFTKWSRRFCVAALVVMPAVAFGQQAMTVSGRVTASGRPVSGASVRIADIRIEVVTDVDGRYGFIIPSANVRGQTVTISARSVRLPTVSASIALRGGAIVQDFDLTPGGVVADPPRGGPVSASAPRQQVAGEATGEPAAIPTDVTFSEYLVGRFPGLIVAPSNRGSATLSYRGTRSIAADAAPLIIVNGVELDRTQQRDPAARFGFGGFDYGRTLDDIDPADVLSVRLLTPVQATAEFGGRAGNGALVVETRDGRGVNGNQLSLTQRFQALSPTFLPEFQNEFGQGSAGQFAFFDGKGGGLNDGLAMSWGPALDGRPLAQASLSEAGRPDVRHWLPQPDDVAGFFENGRMLVTNASLSRGGARGHLYASLIAGIGSTLSAEGTVSRYGVNARGSRQITSGLKVDGFAMLGLSGAKNRAVTGFDLANPVVNLVRTPRQVDLDSLRSALRDADDQPINWIYTGSNNPYFGAIENTNEDSRRHLMLGASATWSLGSWASLGARVGRDHWTAERDFTVATGWAGGFSSARGRLSFAEGGYQSQELETRTNAGEVTLSTSQLRRGVLTTSASLGVARRSHHAGRASVVYDSASVGTDTTLQRMALTPVEADFWNHTTSIFGRVSGSIGAAFGFSAGAARDQESMFGAGREVHVSPFVSGAFDIGQWKPSVTQSLKLGVLSIRGGWARTSTPLMPNETRELYAGAISSDGVTLDEVPLVQGAADVSSERVTSREVGVDAASADKRLDLGLTFYSDRSSSVLIARPEGPEMLAANAAELTNSGVEARLFGALVRTDSREWSIAATVGRNTNTVVKLPDGMSSLALGPSRWNVRLEAVPGGAASTIVGSTFLRDPSGALLLRNGLPIADTTIATGLRVLGEAEPEWFGGFTSALRYRAVDFSVRIDGQSGGRFFSATNRLGATAGTLAETAYRPDTGLLITGIDSATGAANAVHVSTESYFRALGDIAERWVYDASFLKLRELRLGVTMRLPASGPFRTPTLHASIFGRNLLTVSRAPNVDPESALRNGTVRGLELGQLPAARTLGIQVSILP